MELLANSLMIIALVIETVSNLLNLGLPGHTAMTVLFLASVALISKTYWRGGWRILAMGMAVGWVSEVVGTRLGIPFGKYVYSWHGPNLLGVPAPVIFAWGMYMYVSYLSASAAGDWAVLIAPINMVVLDLAVDPVMTRIGLWRWLDTTKPAWFGVPLTNFAGWFLVSLTVTVAYKASHAGNPEPRVRWFPPTAYLLSFFPIMVLARGSSLAASTAALTMGVTLVMVTQILGRK